MLRPNLGGRIAEWSREALVLYFEPVQRAAQAVRFLIKEPAAKQHTRVAFAMVLFVMGVTIARSATGLDLLSHSWVMDVIPVLWALFGYRIGGSWFESHSHTPGVQANPPDQ